MKTKRRIPTVNDILIFLRSKIVQYDMRLSSRGDGNPYRLGNWLDAYNRAADALTYLGNMEISYVVAANIEAALRDSFIVETRDGKPHGMVPLNQTFKALDKAILGKVPGIA